MSNFDMRQNRWEWDVEHFARYIEMYKRMHFPASKATVLRWMQELQAKWPHHKLGDMPHDEHAHPVP